MADEPREELEGRFFDGAASAADDAALISLAEGSPDARQAGARQLVVDRVLRQVRRPPLDPGPIMEAIRRQEPAFVDRLMRSLPSRPPRPRRHTIAATVLGLAAAAGLALWLGRSRSERPVVPSEVAVLPRPEPPRPTTPAPVAATPVVFGLLESSAGSTRILDARARPVPVGTGLPTGASVLTIGAHSGASVTRPDGTRLELGGDGVLTVLDGGAALLARGPLAVVVTGPLVLATPHARLETSARGARLRLEVTADRTRLNVDAGQARLWSLAAGGPVEVATGRFALVHEGLPPAVSAQARSGRALLVVGEEPLRLGDRAVRSRLDRLGYEVQVSVPGAAGFEALSRGSRLVLVSSTVSSADFIAPLRGAPVPVVTWERSLFDDLGMTGPCEEGNCGEANALLVVVKDARHPLAAGESGVLRPTDAGPLTWGTPGLHASWVVTVSGHPDRAAVFAYERGAQMFGVAAPARRVGLFMGDWSAGKMLPAGWRLFDAAVEWADADSGR